MAKPSGLSGKPKHSLWQLHVDADHGSPSQKARQIAELGEGQWPQQMTSTADGKILAFMKRRTNQDLYVGELERGFGALRTPRRFTLDNHDSFAGTWTRDSRSLLFASNRNGTWELFKQGLEDSVPEMIVSSAAGELYDLGDFSPDGLWILYWQSPRREGTAPSASVRLMRQPVAGGPAEMILESPIIGQPTVSCPSTSSNACVLSVVEGKSLRFYSLDPVRGRGDLLGDIEILPAAFFYKWAVSPDGSQLAVADKSHKDHIEILTIGSRSWHEMAVDQARANISRLPGQRKATVSFSPPGCRSLSI
jgi:dipeptidyl aminopeptidase/acylaminoacyl peptidase